MDVAHGYQSLRTAIENIASDLGGHPFMQGVVAREASEELRRAYRETSASRGVVASQAAHAFWLLASEECFRAAVLRLRNLFAPQNAIPATHRSAEHHGGHLVLRDGSLWFETDKARFPLVHSRPDGNAAKMAIWVTSEGEAFAETFGKKPAVSRVFAKAGDGTVKAVQRFASEAFGLPVTPVEATAPEA
ncbi:hypothetical protein [Burkholderia gladioli]|uniref:hypothetical protein n=1 Tax=Burkholderia gladioli TaxID=28095 RepID=UPI00163FE830|nr:hypothetical protein [Burkholderia gladioli]